MLETRLGMQSRTTAWAVLIVWSTVISMGCSHARFDYSGTLQPESAMVGSTIGGRVIGVDATDGQQVKQGQVLVRFDDSAERAALAAAQSQKDQERAALADLLAGPRPEEVARARDAEAQAQAAYQKTLGSQPHQLQMAAQSVRQSQAALAQARAQAAQAGANYARARQLYSQGAISAQALDDARAAADTASAGVTSAQAKLASAQAQAAQTTNASLPQDTIAAQRAYAAAVAERNLVEAGARPQEIEQARAALGAAIANVAAAQTRLREMSVRAPTDGVVESLDLRSGDLVAPGAAVATVRSRRDPYVRIYVVQTDLGRIKAGDHVSVRSDAIAGRTFDGTIETIDQDAQFTPRDVQTAQDRAGLVYGVKVRVHDPDGVLHGGTTVEVAL